jgi:hypothetical protein
VSQGRAPQDLSLARLVIKLVGQWLAAGYLTLPAELLWEHLHAPQLLAHNDFLPVNACVAPLAALWVVWFHRRARLAANWVVGRVVGLLLVTSAVTWVVVVRAVAAYPALVPVLPINPLSSGAVLVTIWAWILVWRLVDRRWLPPLPPKPRQAQPRHAQPRPQRHVLARPERGQVWAAVVPFEEGSFAEGEESTKRRPCLVVSTFAQHACVLKITTKGAGRPGHVILPSGWHPWSSETSWIQLEPLREVPYSDFQQYIRDCPEWAWPSVAVRHGPDATPRPRRQDRRAGAHRPHGAPAGAPRAAGSRPPV